MALGGKKKNVTITLEEAVADWSRIVFFKPATTAEKRWHISVKE